MRRLLLVFVFINACFANNLLAQTGEVSGQVVSKDGPLPFASVMLVETGKGTTTDDEGNFIFQDITEGNYSLRTSYVGYIAQNAKVNVTADQVAQVTIQMKPSSNLEEVVVTGTLKEMSRLESPVPVEVYSPAFLKKNPTPSVYEAMQNVNGVRPQLNCNVCNTGDIHINGLEGPYTMVLIDGMPIVSGLASVYGLSGIPNSMIDRIEIVKGPASTLYGSEAVGGLINVITKKPEDAPLLAVDVMGTSWAELNTDVAFKMKVNDKVSVLSGINYYNYSNPMDNNGDNFTDITLQNRISAFQKWNMKRQENRVFSIAGRYMYEDRWGGELQWSPEFRGGDSVYAESIYTNRWELVGQYQLPMKEKVMLSVSYNYHDQNSVYGNVSYMAQQQIAFSQLTWDKRIGRHDLLVGSAVRYTNYDDNTIATASGLSNKPSIIWLPGIFVQDEIGLNEHQKVLLGARYDYNSAHGNIWTPRAAYKWSPNRKNVIRLNAGTGFRVVNLFTEEHAALTGAREVVVKNKLKPEQSYNVNVNYVRKFYTNSGNIFGLDLTSWYTHFTNQILPDYDTDPNQIIYDNLNGHAVTRGVSLNADFDMVWWGLRGMIGATFMDVYQVKIDSLQIEQKTKPVLTESWTGTWSLTKVFYKIRTTIDYTGNLYGPMRLPTLGSLDPRDAYSPWWSIQNIQVTYASKSERWEFYGGVKNLLNFTPPANSISRSFDPFDARVRYDAQGNVLATTENPYALTFDPSYVYAPNQGIRGFAGVRVKVW